jgi:hypothetical protein
MSEHSLSAYHIARKLNGPSEKAIKNMLEAVPTKQSSWQRLVNTFRACGFPTDLPGN